MEKHSVMLYTCTYRPKDSIVSSTFVEENMRTCVIYLENVDIIRSPLLPINLGGCQLKTRQFHVGAPSSFDKISCFLKNTYFKYLGICLMVIEFGRNASFAERYCFLISGLLKAHDLVTII